MNCRLCSVWRSFVPYFLSDAIISVGLLVFSECVAQREAVPSRNEDAHCDCVPSSPLALWKYEFLIPVAQRLLSAAHFNLSCGTFYHCIFFGGPVYFVFYSRGFERERKIRCNAAELSFKDDSLTLFGLTDRWRVTKSCQMWVNTCWAAGTLTETWLRRLIFHSCLPLVTGGDLSSSFELLFRCDEG